jgi:hypothetical protein
MRAIARQTKRALLSLKKYDVLQNVQLTACLTLPKVALFYKTTMLLQWGVPKTTIKIPDLKKLLSPLLLRLS